MSWRTLPPWSIAAGASLIGGLVVVVLPRHAPSVAQIVMVTIAVSFGVYALIVNVPEWGGTWWASPFDRTERRPSEQGGSRELALIRKTFSARRQLIADDLVLPPEVLRLMQPVVLGALEREGYHLDDKSHADSLPELLDPQTWSLLMAELPPWRPWYRMKRPSERRVADIVHRVLDDLDGLVGDAPATSPDPDSQLAP